MHKALVLFSTALLAGCVSTPTSPPPPSRPTVQVPPTQPAPPAVQGFRAPEIMRAPGLEGVIQADANALVRQFGTPRLDVAEGDMRKLQFAGSACVLDIFLYPLREGATPVATWVQARRASDGVEVDRAACLNALRRR